MVFTIYNKRPHEKTPDENFVCECGHIDVQHSVVHESIDHRLPIELQPESPCTSCQCPKYKFQIKTTLDGWLDILRERQENWKIKKENWDMDIDEDIGI